MLVGCVSFGSGVASACDGCPPSAGSPFPEGRVLGSAPDFSPSQGSDSGTEMEKRAGPLADPGAYPWSSERTNALGAPDPLLTLHLL